MFKRISTLSVLALCAVMGLRADFTMDESTRITGGMVAGMMKVAGVFSKSAREPMLSSISVKGDRMVRRQGDTAQVIDLGKETFTDINFKNKTYSTITFAQMAQVLQEMSRKARESQAKDSGDAELRFKASVRDTGQMKQIQGVDARQTLFTIDMDATDKKTGQTATVLQVGSESWLGPAVSGYDEVRNFYQRMGQKLAWSPGGLGAMAAAQPGMMEGIGELYKEMAKLNGVPVLQIIRMGPKVEGQDLAVMPSGQSAGPGQPSGPSVKGAAGQAAAGAAASRMGRAGALGGALG